MMRCFLGRGRVGGSLGEEWLIVELRASCCGMIGRGLVDMYGLCVWFLMFAFLWEFM